MTNMEIEEPTEEIKPDESREPELPLTGKSADIVPYMDKLRVRNLYGFDWTQYDIAGSLSEAQKTDLTDSGATTLHKHDHGGQDGLDGDDHTQYHTDARGDARYYTETEIDNTVVKLTGNQTVGGIKTLSSIPVLPASDPTTDNQAVRKKYADDIVGGIASVAMGGSLSFTPADEDTTNIVIGFVPKIIFFHATTRGSGTGRVRFSDATTKGTGANDTILRYIDTKVSVNQVAFAGTTDIVIYITDDGTGMQNARITTFASTSVITWEVQTAIEIDFTWMALA